LAEMRTVALFCLAVPGAHLLPIIRGLQRLGPAWAMGVHHLEHLIEAPVWSTAAPTPRMELTNVRIPGSAAGLEIGAFVARPESVAGPLPVLLLLHEIFGLSEGIVNKAQGLADELGCLVIAPDMLRGVPTSFAPRAILAALTSPQDRINEDLDDVCRWAGQQPGVDAQRLAVFGFCYGGGKAIRYTTQARPRAATVVFYGSPLADAAALRSLRAPVCAAYGCDDPQFPQRMVDGFKAALEEAGVEHEVVSYYGVGHAFWKDMGQIEREEMPQIAAYRLATTFLRNFFSGSESFARKRAFLEFMLAQQAAEELTEEGADEDVTENAADEGADGEAV